jgi:hypothetical protein
MSKEHDPQSTESHVDSVQTHNLPVDALSNIHMALGRALTALKRGFSLRR